MDCYIRTLTQQQLQRDTQFLIHSDRDPWILSHWLYRSDSSCHLRTFSLHLAPAVINIVLRFHVHSVWWNLFHRKHYLLHHPSSKNGRILGRYALYPLLKFTLNRKMMLLLLFDMDLNLVFWIGLCRIELHFISFSNPSFPFLFICCSCRSIECCKIYLVFQTMQVIMNGLVSR